MNKRIRDKLTSKYNEELLNNLVKETNIKLEDIAINDKEVYRMFNTNIYSSDKLKVITHSLVGIGESWFTLFNEITDVVKVKKFIHIQKIYGFIHSTSVWKDNIETLLKSPIGITIDDVYATREDISDYLLEMEVPDELVDGLVESVSKNCLLFPMSETAFKEKINDILLLLDLGIPYWYVRSLYTTDYVCKRERIDDIALLTYRLAWFKKYHKYKFYDLLFKLDYSFYNSLNKLSLDDLLEKYDVYVKRYNKYDCDFGSNKIKSYDDYCNKKDSLNLKINIILAFIELNR